MNRLFEHKILDFLEYFSFVLNICDTCSSTINSISD